MTRLERLELSKRRPYAREKPGSPTFLLHGQLSDRFLHTRFIPKGFVPLPRSEGLPTPSNNGRWSVSPVYFKMHNFQILGSALCQLREVPSQLTGAPNDWREVAGAQGLGCRGRNGARSKVPGGAAVRCCSRGAPPPSKSPPQKASTRSN